MIDDQKISEQDRKSLLRAAVEYKLRSNTGASPPGNPNIYRFVATTYLPTAEIEDAYHKLCKAAGPYDGKDWFARIERGLDDIGAIFIKPEDVNLAKVP